MAGLDFYKSQDAIDGARPADIVLPTITDGGKALAGMGESLLADAKPFLEHNAEEAAARDAGVATITKDINGNYVRSVTPKGGGLIYTKALNEALDLREMNLRDVDFENRLSVAAIANRRDPVAFSQVAAGIAEGALATVPPTIKPTLENRWARSVSERSRYLGAQAAEEHDSSLKRAALGEIHTSLQRSVELLTQSPDGKDVAPLLADEEQRRLQAQNVLSGLGVTPEELASMGDENSAALIQPSQVHATLEAVRSAGPIFQAIDTLDKADTLTAWIHGVKTDDKINGLDFDSFMRVYPDRVTRNALLPVLGIKEQNLRRALEEKAPKPMTADEYLASKNFEAKGAGTGITITKEDYAAKDYAFRQRYHVEDLNSFVATPGGQAAVVGLLHNDGIVPAGLDTAIGNLAHSGDIVGAYELYGNIKSTTLAANPAKRVGELWANSQLQALHPELDFVETMFNLGYSAPQINSVYAEKMNKQIKGINYEAFDHFAGDAKLFNKNPEVGYQAVRSKVMQQVLGISDVHQFDFLRGQWEHQFDTLLGVNMHLYDNATTAVNATAKRIAGLFQKSPHFWGGIGDSQVLAHGLSTNIMDRVFADIHAPAKGVSWSGVQNNGQPQIIMSKVGSEPTVDEKGNPQLGEYLFRIFDKNGNRVGLFKAGMDDIVRRHDEMLMKLDAAHRKAAVEAVRPDAWVWGHDAAHGGKLRYYLNPDYVAWEGRQQQAHQQSAKDLRSQLERAGSKSSSAFDAQLKDHGYARY